MGAACSTPPPLPVGSCRLTIHSVVLHNGHLSGEGVTFLRQNLREGVTFLRQNLRPIGEGVTFLSNRHVSSPKPSGEHILGVGWATLRWCVRATQKHPPIARTAHVVHCACATCARVTRVGWSAVSQSRVAGLFADQISGQRTRSSSSARAHTRLIWSPLTRYLVLSALVLQAFQGPDIWSRVTRYLVGAAAR